MNLNITYDGRSDTVQVEPDMTDDEVRRAAVEVVRHGYGDLVRQPNVTEDAFRNFVIDRFEGTIYLRPKVPFGCER